MIIDLVETEYEPVNRHIGVHSTIHPDDFDEIKAGVCRDFLEYLASRDMGLCATHHREGFFVSIKNKSVYKPVCDASIEWSLRHFFVFSGEDPAYHRIVHSIREYLRRVVFVPVEYIERCGGKVTAIDGVPVIEAVEL